MNGFKPARLTKDEKDELVSDCIYGVISADADIAEMYWWLSAIPETLGYLYRKRKKIVRKIDELNDEMVSLSAKMKLVYIHSDRASGSITERKDFAECMLLARSPEYKALRKQLNIYNELLNGCDADITNVEQKSVMVRKMTNIESSRVIYEDD